MTIQSSSLPAANSARAEWRRYLTFLKSPRLPDRAGGFSVANLHAVLRMFGLDLLIMFALMMIAGIVLALGVELPESDLGKLDWNLATIALIVLAAPILEEVGFRGWLSGRPGQLVPLMILIAAIFLLPPLFAELVPGSRSLILAICMFAGAIAAVAVAFRLRGRLPFAWFARLFPIFYALSTVAFALVHLFNYQEGALAVLLPLVIPQLVLGSILGYLRVHYGLWANILLHALHNGLAVGLVLLATSLAA